MYDCNLRDAQRRHLSLIEIFTTPEMQSGPHMKTYHVIEYPPEMLFVGKHLDDSIENTGTLHEEKLYLSLMR